MLLMKTFFVVLLSRPNFLCNLANSGKSIMYGTTVFIITKGGGLSGMVSSDIVLLLMETPVAGCRWL